MTNGRGNPRTRRPKAIARTRKPHGGLPIIAWSLAWAAAIVGASLAHTYMAFPDITLWLVPGWFVGFSWLAAGARRDK